MQLELATRKKAKIKMAIQGPSGSGKTMGALLIAYGRGNWNKIAVIERTIQPHFMLIQARSRC
jgi:Rad3-related DNA helicase